MPPKNLKPQSCPRCAAAMDEVARAPHPRYANLVDVQLRCGACDYETVLAVALLDDRTAE